MAHQHKGDQVIRFRTKKYGSYLDSSYFLKDGPDIKDMREFLIGDRVSISWPCTPAQREAFGNLDPCLIGRDFYVIDSYATNDDRHITTPCIVVSRSHNISRHKGGFGELRYHGLTITLEAVNGYVEDMLLWIMLNEAPTWAPGATE